MKEINSCLCGHYLSIRGKENKLYCSSCFSLIKEELVLVLRDSDMKDKKPTGE